MEVKAVLKKEKENIPVFTFHCHITSIYDNWPQIVTVVYFIFKRQLRVCDLSGVGLGGPNRFKLTCPSKSPLFPSLTSSATEIINGRFWTQLVQH